MLRIYSFFPKKRADPKVSLLLFYGHRAEEPQRAARPSLDVARTTRVGHARPLANSGLSALRHTLAFGRPGSRSQRPFS